MSPVVAPSLAAAQPRGRQWEAAHRARRRLERPVEDDPPPRPPRRLERRRRRERGAHRAPIGEPDAPRVRARAGAIEGPEALGVARGACHLAAIGAARAAQPRIHHRPPERLGARLGRQQRARHRMRLATQLRVDVDVVLKEVEPSLAAARVTGPRARCGVERLDERKPIRRDLRLERRPRRLRREARDRLKG
eukprot:scaffold9342_cov63-Phaeocystis_antarctica.AAC.1